MCLLSDSCKVGTQAKADRYTYIPLIGLFIMAAWVIPELLKKWRYRKEVLFALSTLILSCFLIITWTQVGYWQNSLLLYDHALEVTDNNYLAYSNRGSTYLAIGNYKQAIADYDRAIESKMNPLFARDYSNRGAAYAALGNQKQAIIDYDRAIESNPKYALTYYNRGTAYATLGNQKQAIEDFNRVIAINPKFASAYRNRAFSYNKLGNQQQAYEDLKTAAMLGDEAAQNFLKTRQ